MKNLLLLVFIGLLTFLSCGKNPCTECVDYFGNITATKSTTRDWLYLGPNAFNSFEQSISIYVGGDFNNTPTTLTEITNYKVTISKGNNVLIEQNELDQLSGNLHSGYKINVPVTIVSESISKGSELLNLEISAITDTEQSFKLDGKIQYINCETIDFDDFDSKDCRWSCQLKNSGFEESNCVLCF
ncbi:MAG: hypothetical protein ACJA1A_003547 [Saprospiraceae bacterium]|jgi:hypothetical protein|tara:strand:- start:3902 stop:4459 length:558 start_codon:yes stop_codon:yes gene_type:complete